MFKRISCILTVLALVLCLSSGSLAGITAVADEDVTYIENTTSSSSVTLTDGTYKLNSNITVKLLNVTGDATLDLCGYSITSSNGYVVLVNGGTFTLIDSSTEKTGAIINTLTSTTKCGIKISSSGTLNMNGGNISAPRGIWVANGSATITSGTVQATKDYGIYAEDGSVVISGTDKVEIYAQSTNSSYFGICCSPATLAISNPSAYIGSGNSSNAIKQNSATKVITAGYYSNDISNCVYAGYSCVASGNEDYPYVVKSDTPEVDEDDEGDADSGDGEEEEDSWLYGFSLRLDGAVGVNFYFDTAEMGAPEGYYLVARIGEGGEEEEICSYSEYTDYVEDETGNTYEVNCICYTVYVKPNQFSDMIYVYLTDGTSVTDTYEYSVDTYCLEAINKNLEETDLCKALLNYGYYASIYDSESGTNILDDIDGWVDPVAEEWTVDLSSYSGTTTDGVAKTLILGSSVVIRLYLTADVADDNDVFTFEGNTLEKYAIDDEYYSYYIEFKVPARKMSEMLTVSKNGEEFTKYSVLSYVNNVINSDEYDDALKNLCKAIYHYSVAADNYSGWI
ncbi:MAG: hypothetical protein LIO72_08040 [Ruminococcus sp.]|nr:hypothetical protein [Ruminococcus sp.]